MFFQFSDVTRKCVAFLVEKVRFIFTRTKFFFPLQLRRKEDCIRSNVLSIEGLYICVYLEYQSVCPFVRIGSPPLSRKQVCPPLGTKGREDNTRLRVRGWGEPIWTTGEKAWHSVYSVRSNIILVSLQHQLR